MTTPDPSPRWTPATEDRFAFVVVSNLDTLDHDEEPITEADWADPSDREARDEIVAALRPALAWLADAGLLLPPGGETREEWAVRVDVPVPGRKEHPGDIMTHLGEEKSRRCREVWDGWTPLRRSVTTWPDGATLTSPWVEVTDGE